MKNQIIIIVALTITFTGCGVQKEENKTMVVKEDHAIEAPIKKHTKAEINETCDTLYNLGKRIMTHRQEGYPMNKLMLIFTEAATQKMIVVAYGSPRFSSPNFQKDAIQNFANDVSTECYRYFLNK